MGTRGYDEILGQVRDLCRERKAELLYLTVFGSTLYGTEIEGKSDIDVRGIFLPTMESLALNESAHSIHFTTGENLSRNGSDDIDIDLWSVQHWLQKLLPAGDTGALDVLFSPSHEACTLYRDPRLDRVFEAPLSFLDTENGQACAEYSLGQAKKYGIKGSRLGALKRVFKSACEPGAGMEGRARLADVAGNLVSACGDERFCRIADVNGVPMLFLCGKHHELSTRMTEFRTRLESEMNRYGRRAADAEQGGGIDWKAISHAVRAVRQSREILETSTLRFPLESRDELKAIKTGRMGWEEAEALILKGLEELEALRARSPYAVRPGKEPARAVILSCYGLEAHEA